jgi:hypothetical protein
MARVLVWLQFRLEQVKFGVSLVMIVDRADLVTVKVFTCSA